ncbi:LysR substrate-binding domain-containing protein [Trinickia dinghuensis]|uniref:LysR substrate-binding domain-containing protein n=1 Tax=Trinickia dinghuensis TaxID=2291023 RepID=UPI00268BACB3
MQINCLSSAAAICRLVVDGFGIAVVPAAFVMRELQSGQLQMLKVAHRVPSLPLVVSCRRSPDSVLPESIAHLARAVMFEYSLQQAASSRSGEPAVETSIRALDSCFELERVMTTGE